jgi:putative endonuclease
MQRDHRYYVYILASKPYGTLYTGVTNDLLHRVQQHKEGQIEGFTKRYDVKRLVCYEQHDHIAEAIKREKQIKRWRRDWKIALIERDNPHWDDLYDQLLAAHARRLRLFEEHHSSRSSAIAAQ